MVEPTEEDFRRTDDHEFQYAYGWRRRENGSTEWEPACCYRRAWMWPRQTYCGLPERYHRMRVVQGPVLVRKES